MTSMPLRPDSIRDPDWFAHRYDPIGDLFHMIPASRRDRRKAVFLTDEYLSHAVTDVRPLDRRAALSAVDHRPKRCYVFHSAFCCSTLLANAFELPGIAMSLKEPVVLNDLIGWRRRGGQVRIVDSRLLDVLDVLGASASPEEALIIKPSNVVNALAPAMLASSADSRAVLIYAPLRTFLASIGSKGMWGRLWVRDLWIKLSRDGLTDFGYSSEEILGQTDLQIAALGWLAQHRLFGEIQHRFPQRTAALDSVAFLRDPAISIDALATLFGLPISSAQRQLIAQGEAFRRHAKSGEAFGVADRTAVHAQAFNAHGEEIDKVARWAEAVADAHGIAITLPQTLF